ncbi:9437_t:CDS:1, partial [Funneliformis geosporum]
MSALVLQNSALWPIFEDSTLFILSAFFLIYVIKNQFSNNLPARDGSTTAEIKKTFIEMTNELSAYDTKIANEITSC